MSIETRAFLRDRARTEDLIAAATDCGPAAWSHAHLARLYRARCIDTVGEAAACCDCYMQADCRTLISAG
ncbi:hypothetical protein ABIB28_002588 [Sphingomonas sp. UYEF23]